MASADNQQGSRQTPSWSWIDPSETTRQAPNSSSFYKSYLLGSLHDATLNKKTLFRFSQKGTEWLERLQKLFVALGYKSWIYKEGKHRDVYVLETKASFLDFGFNPLELSKKEDRIAYLRGFFDAEGGIPQNQKRFYIQLVQSDSRKLKMLKIILNSLGIFTGIIHNPSKRVDPFYWRMYILSKSHKCFAKLIGSWHPRKAAILEKRMVI